MTDDERVTRLVRVGSSGRDPTVVVVALVGLLAIALLKPWGEPRPAIRAPSDPVAAATSTASSGARVVGPPSARPRAVSAVERLCYQPTRWWIAAIVRWPGQTVQTREALPAVSADGPLDPVIPFETIHSRRVQAIGYCAPAFGFERPPDDATVAVWRLDSRAAVQIQPPALPTMGGSILGALWSPPSGPMATLTAIADRGESVTWATGRYVFTIQGDRGVYDRWIGVEVVLDGPD
jgi:hypothetical protein